MQKNGSSLLAAVPMWSAFMQQALTNVSSTTFTQPDPTNPVKPILAGNYLYDNQLHTILYYVNKSDPTGPAPTNPAADPQFNNWETALLTWAAKNMPNFGSYNQAGSVSAGSTYPYAGEPGNAPTSAAGPQVTITSPAAGSFVTNTVNIAASVTDNETISKISVLWNGVDVKDFSGPFGTNYNFAWSFTPESIAGQNLLEIDAFGATGAEGKDNAIVYH